MQNIYSAPDLESVSKKLKYDDMSPQNKIDYDAYQKELAISYSVIETAKFEGIQEGIQQGVQKGEFNTKKDVVINAFKNGIEIKMISNITGLTEEAVTELLTVEGLI